MRAAAAAAEEEEEEEEAQEEEETAPPIADDNEARQIEVWQQPNPSHSPSPAQVAPVGARGRAAALLTRSDESLVAHAEAAALALQRAGEDPLYLRLH